MRALLCVVLVGCVTSSEIECPDGITCPDGTECASVTIGTMPTPLCVDPQQKAACATSPDTCDGTCHDGICLPNACGNLLLDENETCDLGTDNGRTDLAVRCSLDCQSALVCGNSIIEPSVLESCDEGDFLSHDGCASSCTSELPRWTELAGHPAVTFGARIAYDSQRRRTVLFGGNVDQFAAPPTTTFEWDGLRWQEVPFFTSPPGRTGAAMTYDSLHKQVVMFSGSNLSTDTWTYDGAWHLQDVDVRPPSRRDAGFAFDSKRGVAVLFGGFAGAFSSPNTDTWEWDGTAWTQVMPATSPPVRSGPAAAFDPVHGVVLAFGGGGDALNTLGDFWQYDGTTWTQITASGPEPRSGAVMTYDPISGHMLLVGGNGGVNTNFTEFQDTWSWDGQSWTQVATSLPANAGYATTMTTDGVRGVAQLFTTQSKIFEWSGSGWVAPTGEVADSFARPSGRVWPGMATYASAREVVMFGGSTSDPLTTNAGVDKDETWIYNGSWRLLPHTTARPSARHAPSFAYDPKHDEVVMFSGCTFSNGNYGTVADTATWIYKNGDWQKRTPATSPPALCGATMVYDSAGERMLIMGGKRLIGSYFQETADTWAWDGTTWSQLPTNTDANAGGPVQRWLTSMANDPVHDQTIMASGIRPAGLPEIATNEMLQWNASDWQFVIDSDLPPSLYGSAIAWNPARQRILMASGGARVGNIFGELVTEPRDDVWEWDGKHWNNVPVGLSPPGRWGSGSATSWDGGILMFGGFDGSAARDDLWLLRWDGDAQLETCANADSDGDALVGCADPDCWYVCTPTCMPGEDCTNAPKLCGNGTCDPIENCASCESDCGACMSHCGDDTCDASESPSTCPGDCH